MKLDTATLCTLAREAGLDAASIVIAEPATGQRVELEADSGLSPASMIKIPIAFALEAHRAQGRLRLTDRVVVSAENQTANDAPSPFFAGSSASLGELGHAMLATSDNVATNVLIDVLGRTTVHDVCARLGADRTYVRRKLSGALPLIADDGATGRNAHPASNAARLFERLAEETAPQWICAALDAQIWNDKLTRGFAPTDRFMHKTGDTDEVSHDGGILTTRSGHRFVVVVHTGLASGADADARHAAFARSLRPFTS